MRYPLMGYPSLTIDTSSTAQCGGGNFKNRKPIGKVGCCETTTTTTLNYYYYCYYYYYYYYSYTCQYTTLHYPTLITLHYTNYI